MKDTRERERERERTSLWTWRKRELDECESLSLSLSLSLSKTLRSTLSTEILLFAIQTTTRKLEGWSTSMHGSPQSPLAATCRWGFCYRLMVIIITTIVSHLTRVLSQLCSQLVLCCSFACVFNSPSPPSPPSSSDPSHFGLVFFIFAAAATVIVEFHFPYLYIYMK